MKPASAKAKGRQTENMLAGYLSGIFNRRVERKRQTGARDQGDLTGLPDWTMEVKSSASRLAEGVDQALREWGNTLPRPRWWVLFARRSRMRPSYWYAVMEVRQWAAIALELERYRRAYGPAPDGYTHQDRT